MKKKTILLEANHDVKKYSGNVNVPIFQTSTILFDSIADLQKSEQPYGRLGTDTTYALAETICKLENGYKTIITPSGLSAITSVLSALLKNGDHILVDEEVYGPTRNFCDNELKKFGIETDYYPADSSAKELAKLVKDNTKLIFLESPGSISFTVQDIAAISKLAKTHNICTIIDNTWSGGYFLDAIGHGVDISIQSCSKYISGHSDILLGSITHNNLANYRKVHAYVNRAGVRASPYDCYLALRGIKTLSVRMEQHYKSALVIAKWLKSRKEVEKVIYPALSSDAGHKLWKKQFTGASGLFSCTFKKKYSKKQLIKVVDSLKLFGIGYSWGGYESLVMFFENVATVDSEYLVRFHIGLEDIDDIKADLEQALKTLK
jgi:cystathionine beta-lyase